MSQRPPDPSRRRLFSQSLKAGASLATGCVLAGPALAADDPRDGRSGSRLSVLDYGARGDGRSPSAEAFQRAIDAAEAGGGGIVEIPPGIFILERTPLIASRVHLIGAGRASVLRGERPDGHRGAALISNKGQQASGYEGASDWSISNVAIDSPKTNGIVVTHAARVYLGWIHGIEVHHHFIDCVARDVLCENLFLTGRSGTSTFQIDSLSGAQTIWDGQRAVAPKHDDTQARDLILRNSIITARAGHAGDRPRHFCSVHFHGEESAGFMFSNLILGGAPIGIYQDADTHYGDIQIDNLRSTNAQAARFNAGRTDQRGLIIRGLIHRPESSAEGTPRGVEIAGHDDVIVAESQFTLPPSGSESAVALALNACHNVRIVGIQARAAGRGIGIHIDGGMAETPGRDGSDELLIDGCQLSGFETGIQAPETGRGRIVHGMNLFRDVARPMRGRLTHAASLATPGADQTDNAESAED